MANVVSFVDARTKALHKDAEDRLRRSGIFDLDASYRRIKRISELRDSKGISWDEAEIIIDGDASE